MKGSRFTEEQIIEVLRGQRPVVRENLRRLGGTSDEPVFVVKSVQDRASGD